jgi:hypothetical protein
MAILINRLKQKVRTFLSICRGLGAIGFWSDNLLSFRKFSAPYPAKPTVIVSLFPASPGKVVPVKKA